jgi:adenosylmethionine-8-amino-7-oxononanoate aminotransferase
VAKGPRGERQIWDKTKMGEYSNWLKANNGKYIWYPFADPKATRDHPPLIIERASGVRVTDIDGKVYLDGRAGLWCVNAGHGREQITQAIVRQLEKLQYYTLFPGFTHPSAIELSVKLLDLLKTEEMARVFFSSGGSDAVETALKIARQYWKLSGLPAKTKIFSFKYGYHGMHFGGTSASGNAIHRPMAEPLVPGFFQAEFPYIYRNPFTQDPEELSVICSTLLRREIENQTPSTVAAIIAEPIIGSGGVLIPPQSFWKRVREICNDFDILFIADEVITGLGRTGALFGVRSFDVKPDIMCLAKALTNGYVPMGATVINNRVAEAWEREGAQAEVMHGYTYSGHPLGCAAAIASLDLLVDEDLSQNAVVVGEYFLARLLELKERYQNIGDVRGRGLVLALELVKDKTTKEPFSVQDEFPKRLMRNCLDNGLCIRTMGHKMIVSPPLIFTKDNVDECIDIFDRSFLACTRN